MQILTLHDLCNSSFIAFMNNHIYSALFKTLERESDRRSKEIEQRKELQKYTQTKQQNNKFM